jgi:hypothetical protein
MCAPCERVRRGTEAATLVRIIHECRRENARKRVPREAYLVVRMRRCRHTHCVLRFTHKSSGPEDVAGIHE